MSAVREVVNNRANELVNEIETLRNEQETAADAARLQDMERDLAELKAFLESGDE